MPDAPGEIIWNDRCKAPFGLPPEAKIDFSLFYSRLHPDDRERTQLAVEAGVSDRQRYDIEYRTISSTGTRWIRATGQTSFEDSGQPIGFSGTTQDITLRKKLEEERGHLLESERAARIARERANPLKDEFLATLSHELRTPLNAILGWVELLKQESDDPVTVQEGLAVIDRNVRVQASLIDDLLDVSPIISGEVRLDTQPLDPSEIVRAAIDTVRPAAQAKGVRLEPIIHHPAPLITGDFGRRQQVIWSLLTNAAKFTPRDGKVQLLLEQAGSNLRLSVTDTGEGIDPEFLPHVFERFRQADGSPSRNHSGLGLDLSIVKTLVELYGGRVSVASEGRGRGASFHLSFPIRLIQPSLANPSGAEKSPFLPARSPANAPI